jgi:hypothetical protein
LNEAAGWGVNITTHDHIYILDLLPYMDEIKKKTDYVRITHHIQLYLECLRVALGVQYAVRMRRIVICGLPDSKLFFPYYLIHDKILHKKVWI